MAAALLAGVLFGAGGASGHAPTATVLYGTGTATVDGLLAPGEWAGARRMDFGAQLPSHDGGGTVPATVRAMNDGSTMYTSLEVGRATYGRSTHITTYFDNDHDGVRELGDDIHTAFVGPFAPMRFFDAHWAPCVPGGDLHCATLDTDLGGTTDGKSAAAIGAGRVVIEIEHPLDSADDTHDFGLGPGSVAGLSAVVRLWSPDLSCSPDARCYADTWLPIGIPDPGTTDRFGHVVVAPDLLPPETTLVAGPPDAWTKVRNASFALEGSDNLTPSVQLKFTCSLDGSAYSECGRRPAFTALRDGRHRLEARAIDELGNVDPTPATRRWAIDSTPPRRPRVRVRVRGLVAQVRLSAVDAAGGPVRYRCSLDGKPYRACAASSTVRPKPGRHVLRALALDRLGSRSTPGVARFRTQRTPR